MHSFARHRRSKTPGATTKETKGLILNEGWRYDLGAWFHDTFSFRGQWRELRQRTITLARLQAGEAVLDVGCGTGTLAIDAHTALAVLAESQALIQGQNRSLAPVKKRPGVTRSFTRPSSSRSG